MNFYTPVDLPAGMPPLVQSDKLLLMGSCFATNIGKLLAESKFSPDINPFGVLYNPLSISAALREILKGREYTNDDLFHYRECWHSAMHHGDFSTSTPTETLQRINARLQAAHHNIHQLDRMMITFGTAWVYEQAGRVVANCHKQPEALFTRRRLEVQEIVSDYTSLFSTLIARNSKLKIILTVSPIRHTKDGMHGNQLSKSTLLLAIDQLCSTFPEHLFYFPAYELVVDELRDYRFYADDMTHPSSMAINHVWQKLVQSCFTPTALQIMQESESINKALSHKPFHPQSDEHKSFLKQIVLKIEQLNDKYPYLELQKEKEACCTPSKQ